MSDLSKLSDDELKALYAQPAPAAAPSADLSKLSDDDLKALYQKSAPAPAEPSTADKALGLAKATGGGIERGFIGLPGLPGLITRGLDALADGAARQTVGRAVNYAKGKGLTYDDQPEVPPPALSPQAILPTSDQVVKAAEGVIGPTYRPQTTPEKYAATVGEFIGSGARPFQAIAGGLASEAAGQATEGTAAEPWARAAAGALAPMATARAVTPVRTDPARIPLANRMKAEGVNLTAGQRTGSKPLQYVESAAADVPGSGRGVGERMETQGQQFNQAVARRMGENADMLTPDVMQGAANRLGGEFNRLSTQNTLRADQQLVNDLAATAQEYSRTLPSQQRETFNNLLNDVVGSFQGGQMQGVLYQRARSRLSRISSGAAQSDPEYSRAIRGLRDALDEGMARSIAPEDAAAWQQAREQYGNMKTVERAMAGAGERTAQGYVSPSQLRTATASGNRQAYVRGQSDLGELARAAEATMRPLPQSGTAPRAFAQGLLTGGGGLGGFMAGGPAGAAAGLASGVFAPAIAGRVLMSRPVQGYLANRVFAPNPDAVAEALLNAQAGYRSGRE